MSTLNSQLKRLWDAMDPNKGVPDQLRRFKGHLEAIGEQITQGLPEQLNTIGKNFGQFTPSSVIALFLLDQVIPELQLIKRAVAALPVTAKGKTDHEAVVAQLDGLASRLGESQSARDQAFAVALNELALICESLKSDHVATKRLTHAQSRLASLEDLVARIKEALAEIKRIESAEGTVPADRGVANSFEDVDESLRRLNRDFGDLRRRLVTDHQQTSEPAPREHQEWPKGGRRV